MGSAEIVQALRGDLSRSHLAKRAGTTPTTISRIESGRHDATLGMLERLASAAGCRLRIEISALPTLAGAAAIDADTDDPEPWVHLRAAAGLAMGEPQLARALIEDQPATDDEWSLNVLAGLAEHIASRHGFAPPAWTFEVAPLADPYCPPGTQRMRERARTTALPELAERNIYLGADTFWSVR